MIVTTNHDNQITTNHIAACLSTDNHFFCFHSSHAAVTIWNHHHRHNTNAINDNIPSTRLIAFLITFINHHHLSLSVPKVDIHIVPELAAPAFVYIFAVYEFISHQEAHCTTQWAHTHTNNNESV